MCDSCPLPFLYPFIGPGGRIGDVELGKYSASVEVSPVAMVANPDDDFKKLKKNSKEMESDSVTENNVNQNAEADGTPMEEELSSDSDSDGEVEQLSMDEVATSLCRHIVGIGAKDVGVPQESTPCEKRGDEQTLIYQEFILDDNVTVGRYLYDNGYSVKRFCRYGLGEEIGEEVE